MMAGSIILSNLQNGLFDETVLNDLSSYLDSAPGSVFVRKASDVALKSIYAINGNFDKLLTSSGIVDIVEGVRLCYNFLKEHPSTLTKDNFTTEKAVYQLLYKFGKQKLVYPMVSLGELVVEKLVSCNKSEKGNVCEIATACYSVYWNANVTCANHNEDELVKLRLIAVKFLLLSNKCMDFVFDKMFATYDKLLQECKRSKEHVKLLGDTSMNIKRYTTFMDTDHAMYCTLIIYLRTVEIFLSVSEPCLLVRDSFVKLCDEYKSISRDNGKFLNICMVLLDTITHAYCKESQVSSQYRNGCGDVAGTSLLNKLTMVAKIIEDFLESMPNNIMMFYTLVTYFQLMLDSFKNLKHCSKNKSKVCDPEIKNIVNSFYLTEAAFLGKELSLRKSEPVGDKYFTNRLDALALQEIRSRSDYLTQQVASLGNKDLEKHKLDLENASRELHVIEKCITSAKKSDTSKPISIEEHCHLANLAYRYVKICYVKQVYHFVPLFLDITLRQFMLWAKDVSPKHVEKQLVSRKLEIGLSSLRKIKHFEDAMKVIVSILMIDQSYLTVAGDMWVKILEDWEKSDQPILSKYLSLYEAMKKKSPQMSDAFLLKIIEAEIKAIQSSKNLPIDCFNCLKVIYSKNYVKQSTDKAYLLLEEAQFLWTKRDESKKPGDVCQEAIDVLMKAKAKTATVVDEDQQHSDMLARAHLLLYVVTSTDPIEMVPPQNDSAATSQPDEDSSRPQSPVSGLAEAALYEGAGRCSLQQEAHSLAPLDRALELWEDAAASDDDMAAAASRYRSVAVSLELLCVLLAAYKLCGRLSHVLRCVRLVRHLHSLNDSASHSSMLAVLSAQTQLLQLATEWRQPALASVVREETDAWIEQVSLDEKKHQLNHTMYLAAKADSLLMENRVNEGLQVVERARAVCGERSGSTKEELLADHALSAVLSKFLLLPPDGTSEEEGGASTGVCEERGSGLEVKVRAVRTLGGVVCFLLGDWVLRASMQTQPKVPVNTLQKWQLLDLLLQQLLSLGRLNLNIGDAREAACYLQQGLKIAGAFVLPKRLAQFHLALAQQDYLSDKHNDCSAHIQAVRYVLTSSEAGQTSSSTSEEAKRRGSSEAASLDTSVAGEDDGEFSIRTKALDLEDELGEQRRHGAGAESPSRTRRHRYTAPVWWSHAADCSCDRCGDVELAGLSMMYTAQHAQLAGMGKDNNAAVHAVLRSLLCNFDRWTNKVVSVLATDIQALATAPIINGRKLETKSVKDGKKQSQADTVHVHTDSPYSSLHVYPSMFQELLVSVGLHLLRLSVEEKDEQSYSEWRQKLDELLNLDTYPYMLLAYHTALAESLHLQATHELRDLVSESVTYDDEISRLCEQIGSTHIRAGQGRRATSTASASEPRLQQQTPVCVGGANRRGVSAGAGINAPVKQQPHRLQRRKVNKESGDDDSAASRMQQVSSTPCVERQRENRSADASGAQQNEAATRGNSADKDVDRRLSPASPDDDTDTTEVAQDGRTYSMMEFLTHTKLAGSKIPTSSVKPPAPASGRKPRTSTSGATKKPATVSVKKVSRKASSGSRQAISATPKIHIWEDAVDDVNGDGGMTPAVTSSPSRERKVSKSSAVMCTPSNPTSGGVRPTPSRSVSSRRAKIDVILDDSDENDELEVCSQSASARTSRTRRATAPRGKTKAASNKTRTQMDTALPLSESNDAVPSSARKAGRRVLPRAPAPTSALFTTCARNNGTQQQQEENEENVFEFCVDSPVAAAPPVVASATGRRGRGRGRAAGAGGRKAAK